MLVDLVTLIGRRRSGCGIAAFNVFGYEDARAVLDAADKLGAPVILSVSMDFTRFMPVKLIADLLRTLAEAAEVQVCAHLDHCYDVEEVCRAVDAGFTSVMFDGSQLPLAANIAATRRVADYAHAAGVSVEGEIGSVPYAEGRAGVRDELTDAKAAAEFEKGSGVDVMAISVGNIHRMRTPGAVIDFARLTRIEAETTVPLVIHGTSGIGDADLARLANTRVAKFNIGTALRQAFGQGVRSSLEADPDRFDRLLIMRDAINEMTGEAVRQMRRLGWAESA